MRRCSENDGFAVGAALAAARHAWAFTNELFGEFVQNYEFAEQFFCQDTLCCREGTSPSPPVLTGLYTIFLQHALV